MHINENGLILYKNKIFKNYQILNCNVIIRFYFYITKCTDYYLKIPQNTCINIMSNNKISILYVDDELNNLVSFKAVFRMKYNVFTAVSGEEAIKVLRSKLVNIIITDQRMPQMTGVEFLETILEEFPDPIRILLTGYADMNAVIDAINKGKIFHYLTKPWNEEELDLTISRAYDVYKQKMDEKETNYKLSLSNEQLEFLLRQKLLS